MLRAIVVTAVTAVIVRVIAAMGVAQVVHPQTPTALSQKTRSLSLNRRAQRREVRRGNRMSIRKMIVMMLIISRHS